MASRAGAKDGIIYATVSTKRDAQATEAIILCNAVVEHVVCSSMENLAPRILSKISLEKATKMSYCYEKLLFHLVIDEHVCYMCVADEDFGRRIPFDFLEKVKQQFKAAYASEWHRVRNMSERDTRTFTSTLQRQIHQSNEQDKMKKIGTQIEEVKGVMQDNIESILSRGEKIDILVQKSEDLQGEGHVFERRARGLRWEMCKRRAMMIAGAVFLCFVLIMIILMIACGPKIKCGK